MSHALQIHIQIHHHALALSSRYRSTEVELIEILEKVENHKVYLHYDCTSLFQYCVTVLSLSKDVTYNLISIMRKTREVPELKNEIKSGNITLTNARKIAPILTLENKTEWLQKASELSQRQLEKEVVKIRPSLATPERARYVTESRIKLEMGLFEKDMMKLRHVQNMVSQAKAKHASLEDVLVELMDFYIQKRDPVVKAKRVFVKKGLNLEPHQSQTAPAAQESKLESESALKNNLPKPVALQVPTHPIIKTKPETLETNKTLSKREPISAALLHQVNLRDQRQCTYRHQDGKRCLQQRWTEIHHLVPVSLGGKNNLENLTTLCSVHHKWVHSVKNK